MEIWDDGYESYTFSIPIRLIASINMTTDLQTRSRSISVLAAFLALAFNIATAAAQRAQDIREEIKRQLDAAEYAQALKSADRLLEAAKSEDGEASSGFAYALSWKGGILLLQGRLSEIRPPP